MTIYTIAQPDIIAQLVIMIFEKDIFFFKVQSIQSTQGRRKRGGGGLSPPPNNFICMRQSKTLRLEKCKPNSDLLKKIKEPRLALSTLLAHMLQAISDLAVQFKPDQLVPKLLICNALFCKISLPRTLEIVFRGF